MKHKIIKISIALGVIIIGAIIGTILYQMTREGFNPDPVSIVNNV